MKRILFIIFIPFLLITAQTNNKKNDLDTNSVLFPEPYHPKLNRIINSILSNFHYHNPTLDDSLSKMIFENYLEVLDFNKTYFLKSDIEKFSTYKFSFDDFIKSGDLDKPYDIFNVFKKRVNQRIKFINNALEKKFDFTKDEYLIIDRDSLDYFTSEKELNDYWRKRIKNDLLRLKLTGKEILDAKDIIKKRYANYHKFILQYTPEDVFQLFINAYTSVIDPHTNYLSPISSDNFKIDMSLSLEGIGAQLRLEEEYTKIAGIIPGGPAAKSGLLEVDDRIVAVAQGTEGAFVDVVGWRLDDVVQLIRGKKGTKVRLSVIKAKSNIDDPTEEILLTRDKVKLEEQAAKKEIITLNNGGINFKIGVIKIPAFYIDFEGRRKGEEDYKSTTRDVKLILDTLKKEKVDGIIVDLRNNGGGSLDEAIDLTGLFIKEGAVVQVRKFDGDLDIGKDTDDKSYYDGPLGVMINRYSASASEIFAGAIQDYGRGLVIGENSYGKGTVQNLIDLSRYLPGGENGRGQIKITIAKFYRISGSSTQHLGVKPDIEFPSPITADEFGESSNPSALPWDKIKPTNYSAIRNLSGIIPKLITRHNERVKTNPEYQYILDDIEEYLKNKKQKQISLNEKVRIAEKEKNEKLKKEREERRAKESSLEIKDKSEIPVSKVNIDDVYLAESSFIISDFILSSAASKK